MTDGNLEAVLPTCENVLRRAHSVTINEKAIHRWAESVANTPFAEPGEDETLAFAGDRAECANFALITDALNFCFWSDQPWEVEYRDRWWNRTYAMVAGLLKTIELDRQWLRPERWSAATSQDISDIFAGVGNIPLAEQRLRIMQETGVILSERSNGWFSELVDIEEADAARTTDMLARCFASFRDVAVYHGSPVAFLKRAQICVADLHRTWVRNGFSGFTNLERLTVFADYRLPQLFRDRGMMELTSDLAALIDRQEIVEAGSEAEVEIRAATIVIGEMICKALQELGRDVASWQLDYELWLRAKDPNVVVPHHRTVTHYY